MGDPKVGGVLVPDWHEGDKCGGDSRVFAGGYRSVVCEVAVRGANVVFSTSLPRGVAQSGSAQRSGR